jgi:predicted TIM-barrel fold metal-dependent hydrolase
MKAVDTHVHLFDPTRFPYRPGVIHTPTASESATLPELQAVLAENAITHAVLVGPMAGYQSDNACLVDGLARGGASYRGIAIVEADVSDAELDRLGKAGVEGVRIDLIARGADYLLNEGAALLGRLAERDWIVDIQCEKDQLAVVANTLAASHARLVIDHMGRPDPASGLDQPGFRALLDLMASGRAWAKLSGPFRFSALPPPWQDTAVFAQALIARYGTTRLIWGSDWPFVRMPAAPRYDAALACLERWQVEPDIRSCILWQTPARLFGFPL